MNTISGISVKTDIYDKQTQKEKKLCQPEQNLQQNEEVTSLSGENWRAISGITENQLKKANRLVNKFALMGRLGIHDIANLKKIIKSGDEQAENVSKLLTLVNEKKVNPKTLKFICKDGIMSDGMEKDINMIFDAKNKGIDPNDAYIPHFNNTDEGLKSAQVGDLFEVEGQNRIYIKNKDGQPEQLKMDKQMMLKLFPPAERFANAQTYSADCYFVSTVNSMMDSPEARAHFLQCFEQDGNDIKITFPSNNFTYTAENAVMPKAYKGNFVTGSTGIKLVEYAYGKYLEDFATNKAITAQTNAIKKFEKQLEKTTSTQKQKSLNEQIKNYTIELDKLTEAVKSGSKDVIVELDHNREPVMHSGSGISLRSLNQMNMYRHTSYQTPGDYYRGDGGYMEDVFNDFGYKETEAYFMDDPDIQEILTNPELSKDYIFSGGTKREGRQNLFHAELVMDRSLSMYGAHAYRIAPSVNKDGETVFKVSNPWNSSHNAILTMAQLKEFFSEIHTAKIQ
ncbi:MAG: hypothetical protein K6C94_00735 [Candidatus Gastranaerophilales bacterium]|nr:hypothetical protein [Candidatus Gastranaerophilales bacterium]